MPITVKLYIEHERLALTPTINELEDVDLKVIAQVNTNPSSCIFPYLIEYDDLRELEAMLDEDPTVDDYELVSEDDGMGIFYIEYSSDVELISEVVTAVNGFMTEAKSRNRGWLVQLQLPDRNALNTIWEFAKDNGMNVDMIGVYDNRTSDAEASYGLTKEQEEALKEAHSCGYFSEPREMTLNDIADELSLSSTAMSGRLRRGMRNLISAALLDDEES